MSERAQGYRPPMSAEAVTRSRVYHGIPSMRPASTAASARPRASLNGRVDVTPQAENPMRRASSPNAALRAAMSMGRATSVS